MVTELRRGQALIELCIGLFALALVVSALSAFTLYIVQSLQMQNSLRVGATTQHGSVEVGDFAAQYLFGSRILNIREQVALPQTAILK